MGRQVVEIIDELVEVTMKTRCESFWLHVDDKSTKIAAPSATQTHELKMNVVP
jgi:hypothetical protein